MGALDDGDFGAELITDLTRIADGRQPMQDAEREAGLTDADIWQFAVDRFARTLLAKYRDRLDGAAWEIANDAYRAGEFEVAAICLVEDAPASADEVNELEGLAASFDAVDREVARRAIAKRRSTPA